MSADGSDDFLIFGSILGEELRALISWKVIKSVER